MNNFKLTIDLLPKGAWGNDFSKTLPKKDWDTLREACYKRAGNCCSVCGKKDDNLNAHEVWDFDIQSKTQTLKDIVALCSACHGVKHMRNSERIGYGKQAKAHFLKINNCSELTFASHYAKAQILFEERNEVLRWKIKADLSKFGGSGIEIKERNIPIVTNPYENINWEIVERIRTDFDDYIAVELRNGSIKNNAKYFTSKPVNYIGPPKIRLIEVDNYQGVITVISDDANKIEWIKGDEIVKTKYNIVGKLTTKFSVEDLDESFINFKLTGSFGETFSQSFKLTDIA